MILQVQVTGKYGHRMDNSRIPKQSADVVPGKWKEKAWKIKKVLEWHTVRRPTKISRRHRTTLERSQMTGQCKTSCVAQCGQAHDRTKVRLLRLLQLQHLVLQHYITLH